MTSPIDTGLSLEEQCEAILAATNAAQEEDIRLGQTDDVVRIWTGEWDLIHVLTESDKERYGIANLDTAEASFEVPTETWIAQWLLDQQSRVDNDEKRNVHLTVDIAAGGQRMGYRLKVARQEDRADGTSVVVAEWMSDMEELKYRWLKPNPFLPDIAQIPKLFLMTAPVDWLSAASLFMDLWREHNPLLIFPDDPLSLEWLTTLDMSTWNMVVKPVSFVESLADGIVWSFVTARWDNFWERMKLIWQDAEVTPVLRRWLVGDDPPWPGANLRNGCLVVSFEDNSGSWTGTSHGGTIADGLLRTIINPGIDLVDSSIDVITGGTVPAEYYEPGNWLTRKSLPYCVYFGGENTGLLDMKFSSFPGTAILLSTGGHSAPGVNEAISATVQAAVDIASANVSFQGYGLGSIGGSVDALLKPFYEDTLLAWIELKLILKAQDQGWSRYYEQFIASAGKAYGLDSVIVLRSGAWMTRSYESVSFSIRDAHPFVVGKHFWIGHRIGAVRQFDKLGRIYMQQVVQLTRTKSRDDFAMWEIEMGSKEDEDPAAAVYRNLETLMGAMRTLGVY